MKQINEACVRIIIDLILVEALVTKANTSLNTSDTMHSEASQQTASNRKVMSKSKIRISHRFPATS